MFPLLPRTSAYFWIRVGEIVAIPTLDYSKKKLIYDERFFIKVLTTRVLGKTNI